MRRALYTLDRLGFVRSDGRLFQLTPKVLSLATGYLASNSLSATLQQAVERVAGQLNEACSAAILDGDDMWGGSSSAGSTTATSRPSWSASGPSR